MTDGRIGIAECDDYLDKIKTCVSTKLPEGKRAMFYKALNSTVERWTRTSIDPDSLAMLPAQCSQAMEMARQAYAPLGCDL